MMEIQEQYRMSMIENSNQLTEWIEKAASLIEQQKDFEFDCDISFLVKPELSLYLVEKFNDLDEKELEEKESVHSACLFTLESCLNQLQFAHEQGNKLATKILNQLMEKITHYINLAKHSLGFWISILNVFYDTQIELTPELKEAYLNLAAQESDTESDLDHDHLEAIRDIILESSDLSDFNIAEIFFAQSHAMSQEFFSSLMLDLYSIEEGHDIALLILLHPQASVREIAVFTLSQLIDKITLSSISLSRLQSIKYWYPEIYHPQFEAWIKIQRKKGVVFSKHLDEKPLVKIQASEIDAEGTQGIFIQIKNDKKNYLAGLILKQNVGIKDTWLTAEMSNKDSKEAYKNIVKENITIREVDISYLILFVKHFLAVMINEGKIPSLHLLEIQEHLGIQLQPLLMDIPFNVQELSAHIIPFTPEVTTQAFKRTKRWAKEKYFTELWYVVSPKVDKLVNRYCSFVDGVKVCNAVEAIEAVFQHQFEQQRESWTFYFLWIALWLKNKARKNEKMGDDSIIIAYAIYSGTPLKDIPLMYEICCQTVINSIETMNERRTYLTKEHIR